MSTPSGNRHGGAKSNREQILLSEAAETRGQAILADRADEGENAVQVCGRRSERGFLPSYFRGALRA